MGKQRTGDEHIDHGVVQLAQLGTHRGAGVGRVVGHHEVVVNPDALGLGILICNERLAHT